MSANPQHTLLAYDLFVSYSAADREWVEGHLLDALSPANVRVLSELNFALGVPRINEFERAIKSSKRTLLVLSPAYIAEAALQFVDVIVQNYGLESGTWPVIPLLLNRFVNLRSTGKAPTTWEEKPAQGQAAPASETTAVPIVTPPPAQSVHLDQLADEAVAFVANLRVKSRLQSASQEDDAGIQYLKSASARRGLVASAEQIAGAWEATDKPWRVTR